MRKYIKIAAVIAAACLLLIVMDKAEAAGSQSDDVSWVHPTSRVDGTPLSVEEIEYTEVEVTRDGQVIANDLVPAPGTVYSLPRDLPPNYTVCYRARTKALDPVDPSEWTGQVCKTVKGRPNPPGQLDAK